MPQYGVLTKLKSMKKALSLWNKESMGDAQERVRILYEKVEVSQRLFDISPNDIGIQFKLK